MWTHYLRLDCCSVYGTSISPYRASFNNWILRVYSFFFRVSDGNVVIFIWEYSSVGKFVDVTCVKHWIRCWILVLFLLLLWFHIYELKSFVQSFVRISSLVWWQHQHAITAFTRIIQATYEHFAFFFTFHSGEIEYPRTVHTIYVRTKLFKDTKAPKMNK